MSTNFETWGQWKQDKTDEFDWTARSDGTPSFGTGPSSGQGGSGQQ